MLSTMAIMAASSMQINASATNYPWSLWYYPTAPTSANQMTVNTTAQCSGNGRMRVRCNNNPNDATIKFEFKREYRFNNVTLYEEIEIYNENTISRGGETKNMNGNFINGLWYICTSEFTLSSYGNTTTADGVYK